MKKNIICWNLKISNCTQSKLHSIQSKKVTMTTEDFFSIPSLEKIYKLADKRTGEIKITWSTKKTKKEWKEKQKKNKKNIITICYQMKVNDEKK